jgi:hypothetical protein
MQSFGVIFWHKENQMTAKELQLILRSLSREQVYFIALLLICFIIPQRGNSAQE